MTQEQEQAVEILVNEYRKKLIETISSENRMIKPSELMNEVMERIVEDVAKVTMIEVEQIKGRKRQHDIVRARQLCIYMIYTKVGYSVTLEQIGLVMNKNHATVIHSVRIINNYIDTKNKYVMQILDVLNDENKIAA
jgi:chromosomal replication initiation ATPase DnaA